MMKHQGIIKVKWGTIVLLLGIMGMLGSCSVVKLEHAEKSPEIVLFHANKVLLVGMTYDAGVREQFETRLQQKFSERNIETMRSIDLFDVEFTLSERTEKELDRVEAQLLDKDFDAILITKVISSKQHSTLHRIISDFDRSYEQFTEDYLVHQGIYYDRQYYDTSREYQVETTLYCICEGKERARIWQAGLRVIPPKNRKKAIEDYVKTIVSEMEKQDVIFYAQAL